MHALKASFAAAVLLLAGCAAQPMGPHVAVMPAPGKPFDVFQQDQDVCTSYARQQTAGMAQQAETQQLGTAAVATVLGAGLGAAVGGGHGAAIGAAAGAIGGTAIGAGPAERASRDAQRSYDIAYEQCMTAKGNQVPVAQSSPTYVVPAPPYGAYPAPVYVPVYPQPYPAPAYAPGNAAYPPPLPPPYGVVR